MTNQEHLCRSCGKPLAADNSGERCASCEAADRRHVDSPPVVPPEFWQHPAMQEALRTRHMGKVIRAYRHQGYHGYHGVSQELMGNWAHTSQAHISRIENGAPMLRLDQLDFWAKLLGIPHEYLWFAPNQTVGASADLATGDAVSAGRLLGEPSGLARGHSESTHRPIGLPTEMTGPRRVRDRRPRRDEVIESSRVAGGGQSAVAGMTQDPTTDPTPTLPNPPIHIDIATAQPARMGDYLERGGANFAVDREVTDYIADAVPGGIDAVRSMLDGVVGFQERVVRYLAGEIAMRQFLNIATSVPTREPKMHEVAQEIAPEARFTYVIEDGVVMAHAHRLQSSTPEGTTTYIRGGLRNPDRILREAGATLDLAQPVAILIRGGDLNLIPDDDTAYQAVARLLDTVPTGSYLVLTHLASDLRVDGLTEALDRIHQLAQESRMPPLVARTRAQVAGFFNGLKLIGPNVAPVNRWRPNETIPVPTEGPDVPFYGAVGHKP